MKKLLTFLLSAALLLSLVACGTAAGSADTTAADSGLKKITVTIVHADGSSKELSYETDAEFLGPLLEAEGIIKGNAGPYGLEITEVDGEKAVYNEDKAYWALYEGAQYALQGIDTTPVTDGGIYKLEYTRG